MTSSGRSGGKSKRTASRSNSGTSGDTWYVTFHHPDAASGDYYIRNSKTFRTEAEAKEFAHTRILEGYVVTAGTLNPHLPKRIISFSQLEGWLTFD